MPYLSLKNVSKIYAGGVQAVYDFNLDIEAGEFIVLVGPSGCGKSTTLRMIAGLEGISGGDMHLGGVRINDMAPSDRDIAMVFQDYALYGNMTVYQNIGFSLTVRREDSDTIHNAVMDVARTVDLREYLNRFPKALSGGQKQRVAMGRSIARNAKVLLMDEPLSNLDAKLRQQTRKELVLLHRELNATIVYVTHDQIEAMTMASRIVVMNEGYIQQVGTPYEIYNYPENIFTAVFIGMPSMNLIKGSIKQDRFIGVNENREPVFELIIPPERLAGLEPYKNSPLIMGIRPENILTAGNRFAALTDYHISGTVRTLELLGAEYNAGLDVKGLILNSRIPSGNEITLGRQIDAAIDINRIHFFDEKTGKRIKGNEA